MNFTFPEINYLIQFKSLTHLVYFEFNEKEINSLLNKSIIKYDNDKLVLTELGIRILSKIK